LTDFDNEYVWHCHILGHEENDFMRPFIFHPAVQTPDAPGSVTKSGDTVTWVDPTPFGGRDSLGVPTAGLDAAGNFVSSMKNEIGFRIYPQDANGNSLKDAVGQNIVLTARANTTTLSDPIIASAASVVVSAYNAAGESTLGNLNTANSGSATAATGGSAAATATALTLAAAATAPANTAAADAVAAAAAAAAALQQDAALAAARPVAPGAIQQVPNTTPGTVSLFWANNALNVAKDGFTNVSGYTLSWGNRTWALKAVTTKGLPNGATITGLQSGQQYTFSLVANNAGATITRNTASRPVTLTVTAP
jgi:hypothetical protein